MKKFAAVIILAVLAAGHAGAVDLSTFYATYGGGGDAKSKTDGVSATSDCSLSSASAGFSLADVKSPPKYIVANGAAAGGGQLVGVITAFVAPNKVSVSPCPSTNASGELFSWGSDNGPALSAAAAVAAPSGDEVVVDDPGCHFVTQANFTRMSVAKLRGVAMAPNTGGCTGSILIQISQDYSVMLDFSGSNRVQIDQLQIGNTAFPNGGAIGIFLANGASSSQFNDNTQLTNLYLTGPWNGAPIYDYGVPVTMHNVRSWNYDSAHFPLVLARDNPWSVASPFGVVLAAPCAGPPLPPMNPYARIRESEFHNIGGSTGAIWARGVIGLDVEATLLDSPVSGIYFNAACGTGNAMLLRNDIMYSETGTQANNLLTTDGSSLSLGAWMINNGNSPPSITGVGTNWIRPIPN